MLEHFLAKEPAPAQRVEILGAYFAAEYFNFNKDPKSPRVETQSFLLFRDAFKPPAVDSDDERYSELDREVFAALTR